MPGKKNSLQIAVLFSFVFFFACSGLQKPTITKTYFDLNFQAKETRNHRLIRLGSVLMIKELSIASEFDSHSFVYRLNKQEYTTDFYNEFVIYPARLITGKIAEKLYGSEHFSPFSTRKPQDLSYRLFGKITALYGDYQDKDKPAAVMGIRFILEKKEGTAFKKVFARTYQLREPLSSPGPEHLASAWGKELAAIMSNLIDDLARQGLTGSSP